MVRNFRRVPLCLIALVLPLAAQRTARPAPPAPILEYIQRTWDVLTRSHRTMAAAVVDPKFPSAAGGRQPVYVSRAEDLRRIAAQLRQELPAGDDRRIELRPLSDDPVQLREQGLLYLPRPYV